MCEAPPFCVSEEALGYGEQSGDDMECVTPGALILQESLESWTLLSLPATTVSIAHKMLRIYQLWQLTSRSRGVMRPLSVLQAPSTAMNALYIRGRDKLGLCGASSYHFVGMETRYEVSIKYTQCSSGASAARLFWHCGTLSWVLRFATAGPRPRRREQGRQGEGGRQAARPAGALQQRQLLCAYHHHRRHHRHARLEGGDLWACGELPRRDWPRC